MAIEDTITGIESAGDPTATNPNSSATGLGQFVKGTWLDMMSKYKPDMYASMSPEQLLALRNDPALSKEMTARYAEENSNILKQNGFDPSPGNVYLAHFAGPQGATSLLGSDPATPAIHILGDKAVAANPFLRGKTAGDVINWAQSKVGGGPVAINPGAMNAPAQLSGASPLASPVQRGILGQALDTSPDKATNAEGLLARNAPGQPAATQEEGLAPMKLGGILSQTAPRQARPFQLSFQRPARRAFG